MAIINLSYIIVHQFIIHNCSPMLNFCMNLFESSMTHGEILQQNLKNYKKDQYERKLKEQSDAQSDAQLKTPEIIEISNSVKEFTVNNFNEYINLSKVGKEHFEYILPLKYQEIIKTQSDCVCLEDAFGNYDGLKLYCRMYEDKVTCVIYWNNQFDVKLCDF